MLDEKGRPTFAEKPSNDLRKAREIHNRIAATVEVFYANPFVDMHNRMKEALVVLGRIPSAVVRPPLVKPSDAEIERIRRAMDRAGIRREGAFAEAA
jgi:4-hydroxy-tetrahydrodipicolinate synthase